MATVAIDLLVLRRLDPRDFSGSGIADTFLANSECDDGDSAGDDPADEWGERAEFVGDSGRDDSGGERAGGWDVLSRGGVYVDGERDAGKLLCSGFERGDDSGVMTGFGGRSKLYWRSGLRPAGVSGC